MAQQLLDTVSAANSPPTAATDGVALRDFKTMSSVALVVYGVVTGSQVGTITGRLWLYSGISSRWAPAGTGTASGKGLINDGAAIAETGTDVIDHTEVLDNVRHYDRAYLELTVCTNMDSVDAWLVGAPEPGSR
jgi:hypothetical protein